MDSTTKRSSIIAPDGRKLVMLGGDVYDQRITGDIISEFKWIDGEPVMLIYKRVLGRNTPGYMIEMKDAYIFATSSGHPTKRLIHKLAHEAAKALNSEHDKATIFRLIDVIMNGLADLVNMPPEPKALEIANRPVTGEAEISIKVDGKTIIETVI